jgi:hypothetical protein
MSDDIQQHDARVQHCPSLGHDITFSYCRAPAAELPCRRIFDCWWESFDIVGFISRHCTPQQLQRLLEPRKDKLTSILELVEKAKAGRPGSQGPAAQ